MNNQINYPTFEDVLEQLTTRFPKVQVHMSTEELKELSRILSNTFEEMKKTGYQGLAESIQPAPRVQLCRWPNATIRDEEQYSAAYYSSIDMHVKKFKEVEIHIVNVWGVKRIELHFVSVITNEEKKQIEADCEALMNRMDMGKDERKALLATVLPKLI